MLKQNKIIIIIINQKVMLILKIYLKNEFIKNIINNKIY